MILNSFNVPMLCSTVTPIYKQNWTVFCCVISNFFVLYVFCSVLFFPPVRGFEISAH